MHWSTSKGTFHLLMYLKSPAVEGWKLKVSIVQACKEKRRMCQQSSKLLHRVNSYFNGHKEIMHEHLHIVLLILPLR